MGLVRTARSGARRQSVAGSLHGVLEEFIASLRKSESSPTWCPHGFPWYGTKVRDQSVPAGEMSRLDPNDCGSSLMSNVNQMKRHHGRIRIYRGLFSTASRKSSGCIGSGSFSAQSDSAVFRRNSGKSEHAVRTSGKRRKNSLFYQVENRELLAVLREMLAVGSAEWGENGILERVGQW